MKVVKILTLVFLINEVSKFFLTSNKSNKNIIKWV